MKKHQVLLVAVLVWCSNLLAQTDMAKPILKNNIQLKSDRMTPEALWAMGRIGGYAASPNGQMIVYNVAYYSVKLNKSHHVLYLMNADGSNNQLLTTSAKNETDAAWLDNETIAFLTDGEIWSMKTDGTNRKQLSKTDGKVEGFKFSPDKQKVIILQSIPFNEVIQKNPDDLPKATGRLVTDLMYRHWDHYVESIQHPFVASVTPEGIANPVDILDGLPYECPMEPFGGIEQLDWSPDSKKIAYTCRMKTGRDYSISTDSDIWLFDLKLLDKNHKAAVEDNFNLCKGMDFHTGKWKEPEIDPTKTMKFQTINAPENLKYNVGYDQNPKFSPDGRYVAWLSMERNGYEADRQRLCCYDITTGEKKYLTESFDSNVDDFCWSDNTKDALIYYIGVWHGTENLYAVMPGTKKSAPQVVQLTNTWHDFGSLQMLNNGRQILAERHCFTAPADLYLITPNSKKPEKTTVVQITNENKSILDQLAKPTVQQRWVKTTDGKDMLTWIILPPNFDETKKYPTLLFCEGGPQSPVSQFWSYRWNFMIMASQGYIIVAPNRRGLPGFGQEWLEEISGDWTGQCMKDYLSAIDDAAQNLPYVDRDHLGAVGASFGGFSVYYLAGHHEGRFKCFIAHDGAFNLEAMYTETEENWFSNWEYDDAYWNTDQTSRARRTYENSPHRFVDKWDTPILCIHGEKDYRINATQGMSAFNAARMRGIEAQLLIFPDENHWVLKPQNGVLWQRTYFNWLDRWLK